MVRITSYPRNNGRTEDFKKFTLSRDIFLLLVSSRSVRKRPRNSVRVAYANVIFEGTREEKRQSGKEESGVKRRYQTRDRPLVLTVGRHLIYCFNYIRIYR